MEAEIFADRRNRLPPDTQLAICFKSPQIDSRLLEVKLVHKVARLIARYRPFLSVEEVPIPSPDILGENGEVFDPVYAGVCGSDRKLVKLGMALSALTDIPNVPPPHLSPLNSLIQLTAGRNMDRARILRSLIIGHEILAKNSKGELGVLYPIISCVSKFPAEGHCPYCKLGQENLCLRTQEGPVRGLALGFGAVTNRGEELGGGFSSRLVAYKNMFIPKPEGLNNKVAVMTDPYACAVNGVEMVKNKLDDNTPVLIIGMGTIGFCVMDYLSQNGVKNITVAAKYPSQQELVKEYGYSPDQTQRIDKFPVIFDCVGSTASIQKAFELISPGGTIVELGMPQDTKLDLYQAGRRQATICFPFWATREQFSTALFALEKNQDRIAPLIAVTEDLKNVKDAFFPQDSGKHIKHVIQLQLL